MELGALEQLKEKVRKAQEKKAKPKRAVPSDRLTEIVSLIVNRRRPSLAIVDSVYDLLRTKQERSFEYREKPSELKDDYSR